MTPAQSVETLLRAQEALVFTRNWIGSECLVGRVTDAGLILSDVEGALAEVTAALQSIPEPLSTGTVFPADFKLPCDVMVPPVTTIKAGCNLGTLMLAITFEGRPTSFDKRKAEPLLDEGLVELAWQRLRELCPHEIEGYVHLVSRRDFEAALSIPRLEAGRVTEAMRDAADQAVLNLGHDPVSDDALDAIYLAMSSTPAPDGEDR